jgi:hypothetical protein
VAAFIAVDLAIVWAIPDRVRASHPISGLDDANQQHDAPSEATPAPLVGKRAEHSARVQPQLADVRNAAHRSVPSAGPVPSPAQGQWSDSQWEVTVLPDEFKSRAAAWSPLAKTADAGAQELTEN